MSALEAERVVAMVVNGACEADWPEVMALARSFPRVLPSFGYHPWYVGDRTEGWLERLREMLDQIPSAVGEIGLDRWIRGADLPQQEEVFLAQLRLAEERDLPVSIHCLRAWGRLYDLLRSEARPRCGFLLHSYGGPVEMVRPLAALGGYFSFPGYYMHDRKARQREAFRQVPSDRLLLETDAPDQPLPPERTRYPLPGDGSGKPVNHPANLVAIYEYLADWLNEPIEELAGRVEANFHRLFKTVLKARAASGWCRPVDP